MKKSIPFKCFNTILIFALFWSTVSSADQENKTYEKDEQGRVLIYRSAPRIIILGSSLICCCLGLFCLLAPSPQGKEIKKIERCMGLPFLGLGAYILNDWIYTLRSMTKPILILDKEGLWYEGYGNVAWDDIKKLIPAGHVCRDDGVQYYLEVVTKLGKQFEIREKKIAISMEELLVLTAEYCRDISDHPLIDQRYIWLLNGLAQDY